MPSDASKDHAFLAAIVETASDAIASKTLDGVITSWNKAAEQMFGYTAEEVIGQPMTIIFPPERLHEEAIFLGKIARNISVRHYETVRVRKDGSTIDVSVSLSPILDQDGRVIGAAKIVRDISERKQLEKKLEELARTDPLTGLANRRTFVEAIEAEFLRYRRLGSQSALLMIDIDHFKVINDAHGHEAGDHALVTLARCLKTMARGTDLVARFGGEEFVILLVGADLSGAMDVAERIREAVAQIIVPCPSGDFALTVSIGVASFLGESKKWSDVLADADKAMYVAKNLGRNRISAFSAECD